MLWDGGLRDVSLGLVACMGLSEPVMPENFVIHRDCCLLLRVVENPVPSITPVLHHDLKRRGLGIQ